MLFTPPKYGKDWTRFLAVCFYVASIGFAISAVATVVSHFDDLSDKILAIFAFFKGRRFGAPWERRTGSWRRKCRTMMLGIPRLDPH